METTESTEESPPRSLDVQPSSEEQESTSDPLPSSGSSPKLVRDAKSAPAVLKEVPHRSYSVLTEPSSDSLLEASCPGSHQIGHGRFGYQPLYISYVTRNPCTREPRSIPDPASGHICGTGRGSGPPCGRAPAPAPAPEPAPAPAPAPEPAPAPAPAPADPEPTRKVSFNIPQEFRSIPPDLPPKLNQYCYWELRPQPWEHIQVKEPGVRGPLKPQEAGRKPELLYTTLPRGQCLLHNWVEERATNCLDEIPRLQDGSESYFFRHGHQGLLSMQLQSPMSSSTTQKDSYSPPRNVCQPLRGNREASLEMLLYHQVCKEVQAEQEPSRKLFEAESVTHHDYGAKLVQTGPPAPTKPHDYRLEQPETFWIQRAPQLQGVSDIRTLDTPFRKNCSFSTPVPLSLGQPLPYELETFPHQIGAMSSLACQGGGEGCGGQLQPKS